MKVLKINHEAGFQWLLPKVEGDNELLRFDCSSRASTWEVLRMAHVDRLDGSGPRLTKRSDFPCAGSSNRIILNKKAKNEIGQLFEQFGELLPLISEDGEPYWALNVMRFVDALNEEQSTFLRASETGRIMSIKKHVFAPNALVGEQLFKLPQTPMGLIYATDAFVETIRSTDLSGIGFIPVWELRSN